MGEIVLVMVGVSAILVISLVWKAFSWVWLKPMKLQKYLKDQGMRGPPYKLLFGNIKENVGATKEAGSKPMELSHRIVPRVIPFIQQTVQTYGKISVNWLGPTPMVQIMDPDLIRDILSHKFGDFAKMTTTPVSRLLIGGLVSYEGEKWAKHRKIINPAFHLEKLKMMLPAFHTSCSEMINKWQKLVSEGSSEVDVWPEFQNLTGDVISRAAFGSSYKEGQRIFQLQIEQAELVLEALQTIYVPGFRFLPTKRNRRMKAIYNEVRTVLRDIIHRREKDMKMGKANTNDLLGLLMESNFKEIEDNDKSFGMSIDDVIEECKLFYFAGQETTSTLILWTTILLSMHPDWQAKAREEVLQVFGDRKPDFDGLNHLKTMTMILYEVLRLYPSAVYLTRGTYKPVKIGEISLPEGVHILLPTLLIHHDRELWGDDVEEFKPERFAEGILKATKNRASFFPFGWGPRICIGQNFSMMEAKMAIAMILQHFSFELSPAYVHAPSVVITLQPQHGAPIILHKH